MADVTKSVPKADTHREIHEEHQALGRLLAKAVLVEEVTRLRPLLTDLRGLLARHFEREEGEDGFYRVVEEAGPHLLPKVQSITSEHDEFLAAVDRLVRDVDACIAGPVAEIRHGVQKLARDLESHEAKETELLSDSFYTELGGGS